MRPEDSQYLIDSLGAYRYEQVFQLLNQHNCRFKTTRPRVSKRGDFRVRGKELAITVNRDPNSYRFVITLVHELAHLKTYSEYKSKVAPHGKEWKNNHRSLLQELNIQMLFDEDPDLQWVYHHEFSNPKACSGVDIELERILSRFDHAEGEVFLEDLDHGSNFEFRSNQYRKLEERRSRVLCLNLRNNRKYTINKASKVKPF